MRPFVVEFIRFLGLPIPNVAGGDASIGVVGLTASSGIAACIEFLLLRRGMQKRIGSVKAGGGYEIKLWTAAILAGVTAFVADRYFVHDLTARLPLAAILDAIVVSGIFGAVYFGVAAVLGVPEVGALVARFR